MSTISNATSQRSSYTSNVAVLEVKGGEDIDYTLASSNPSLSSRSSMSSLDSNHDHTVPLELGLVINALQTSLVEQEQEEEKKSTAQQQHQTAQEIADQVELHRAKVNAKKANRSTATIVSKKIKREDAVVVDYELDHGVDEKYNDYSTSTANLIVLDGVDSKSVVPNTLTPREQEKAGKCIVSFLLDINYIEISLLNR
jgi:hypothetical protein